MALSSANASSSFDRSKLDSLQAQWDRYWNLLNSSDGLGDIITASNRLKDLDPQLTAARNEYNNAVNSVQNQLRARDTAAQAQATAEQTEAGATTQTALNSGITRARAGLLGDSRSETTGNVGSSVYNTTRAGQASSQADYLRAMGQLDATDIALQNMEKSAGLTTLAAGLSGAASGAQTGFLLSDEDVKEYNNHSGLPKADVEDALRKIESVEYKYKPEYDDGSNAEGTHVGTTAQSYEDTAFEDVVVEKNGVKALDKQLLLEAVMAGIAALQKEIDELKENNDERNQ